jgi:serine/threonine protein kinase
MAPRTKTRASTTTGTTEFILDETRLGSGVTFEVDLKSYEVGKPVFEGDVSNFYECSIPEGSGHKPGGTWFDRIIEDEESKSMTGLLKVAKNVDYNPLIQNEVQIISKLFPSTEEEAKFFRYFPRVVTAGTLASSGRAAFVLPFYDGFVTMQKVREAFPTGLDFRDIVWMFKRTLVAIGFAHTNGIVHGAVLPPHVLVHPVGHGAKLLDWTFAVEAGDHIKGVASVYGEFYPPEVYEKENARPTVDIYMAAKCCVALLGGDTRTNELPTTVPKEIQAFLDECLVRNPSRRPQDAWDLHETFDHLLRKLVGPPEYRLLQMPA